MAIRITGGALRGRVLPSPPSSARPTLALLRRSLFDRLHYGFGLNIASCAVLDLFAGSGALGFEALSRGAPACAFVDSSPEAAARFLQLAPLWQLEDKITALTANACRLPPRPGAFPPAGLVFADPPYRAAATGESLAAAALASAQKQDWLAAKALVVVEKAPAAELVLPQGFTLLRTQKQKKRQLLFIRAP